MKRGSYQVLYYSPTSNFIKINSPENNLTCDKSIYEDMEQVSASKTVPIPRQFYSLMPPAQAEHEKLKNDNSKMHTPTPNSNTVPEQQQQQTEVPTFDENTRLPAAAATDQDMNDATSSNKNNSCPTSFGEEEEEEVVNKEAHRRKERETEEVEREHRGEKEKNYYNYSPPMHESAARFTEMNSPVGGKGNKFVERKTMSFGQAFDSSQDRMDEFENDTYS